MKLAICTGGGDCPGLNPAIRAVVKYARNRYNMEIVGIEDSFNGLITRPLRSLPLTSPMVTDILDKGGTILGTSNFGNTLKGADEKKHIALIKAGLQELGCEGLIVVGGEGTQGMAQKLVRAGINIIGLPKTIDNDLPGTEQTIGFSTCVDLVAESVLRLRSTAESHDRIMIIEVMGRDSGYIALHGGIAGGAQIILLPEIKFSYQKIVEKIRQRQQEGRKYSLIVVSEGACAEAGEVSYNQHFTQQKILGGIGQEVATKLRQLTSMDTRYTVLGHLQRGGAPNAVDKLLATRFAIKAVDLASQRQFGFITVLKNNRIDCLPYNSLQDFERQKIASNDDLLLAAEGIGICLGR
jgi:ATP-dependent phosphofructokinase / diphosphate-dependent phosphofructokinase